MFTVCSKTILRRVITCTAAFLTAILTVILSIPAAVSASSGSAAFVSQSAALETSTIRGLLSDISVDVRGPASSYTLTIDSSAGEDVKALLAESPDIRYSQLECYDLSLTAVNSQSITRNPQFGDATITIPLGSSMNPSKGTFAVYTVNTDGSLQRIACDILYGRSSAYAVRFITIHFSTYVIAYTAGGSTRVVGSVGTSGSGTVVSQVTDDRPATGTQTTGNETGTGADTASAGTNAALSEQTDNAATTAATATPSSAGKDANGKDPYVVPKTGDRRHYGLLLGGIFILLGLFLVIARLGRRAG